MTGMALFYMFAVLAIVGMITSVRRTSAADARRESARPPLVTNWLPAAGDADEGEDVDVDDRDEEPAVSVSAARPRAVSRPVLPRRPVPSPPPQGPPTVKAGGFSVAIAPEGSRQ